jgi:gamma-resorcylate decarboxylase
MVSGLFDRFPELTFILHLGETLWFNIWRSEHRASYLDGLRRHDEPLSHYLHENFYVTTIGNFRTQTLLAAISDLGVDRILVLERLPLRINARGRHLV